jgi:aryl-alcohol dehydrogenase-like predicted oxidoreductase
MQYRELGRTGIKLSAIGLGCSGMSPEKLARDDAESAATIGRALDLGVNLLDTSDAYGAGHNEELVAGAIKGRRDEVVVSTKFGNIRGPKGQRGGTNARPDYVPVACENSLKRLGIEVIDLYYLHRVDPGCGRSACRRRSPISCAGRTRCIRSRRWRPSIRCGPASRNRTSCRYVRN